MTSAKHTPAGVTADRTAREAIIRDLYSIAAFYIANPDHPLPTSINLYSFGVDMERVQHVADRWAGGKVYGEPRNQVDHVLPRTSMPVRFLTSARSDR